jgi:hypothetical protein
MQNAIEGKVDIVKHLSTEEFNKKYYDTCTPVVITEATSLWKAHQKWSVGYFKTNFGNEEVKVGGKKYSFTDFLNVVEKSTAENPSPYLNEVNIIEQFPKLLEDIMPEFQYTINDRLKSKLLPERWGLRKGIIELLIGGKGTCFPVLHFDGVHHQTFVTQIIGDKEFYFISPNQTANLYVADKYSNKSPVNFFNPDFNKHPLFKNVTPLKVVVKRSQTIYIPSGWWHTTRLLDLSIAVSINGMNKEKWNQHVDDFTHFHFQNNPLKKNLFKYYMLAAGKLMSISESFK